MLMQEKMPGIGGGLVDDESVYEMIETCHNIQERNKMDLQGDDGCELCKRSHNQVH